ncbi:MAG: hypothetical protein WCS37_02070 [Chloroflexota bacterium]|nr:hypothetical protein [Chloroflexota bacterium]
MRLGLVEKGNYKTREFDDLTGYGMEVNGYTYDFGRILAETRQRVQSLWKIECPPDLLRKRLHFSELQYFNRMVKTDQYGIFYRNTGANVCLGLVDEEGTCNLVIHELAHEMHYRQGRYESCDEYVQECLAIMTEQEFGRRSFEFNPHFTGQQMLDQLMELPGFGPLSFLERWEILSKVGSIVQLSALINRYLDDREGRLLARWLETYCPGPEEDRMILNALAQTSQSYALYNRYLLLHRFIKVSGKYVLDRNQVQTLVRALGVLRELDQRYPDEPLTNLMEEVFGKL